MDSFLVQMTDHHLLQSDPTWCSLIHLTGSVLTLYSPCGVLSPVRPGSRTRRSAKRRHDWNGHRWRGDGCGGEKDEEEEVTTVRLMMSLTAGVGGVSDSFSSSSFTWQEGQGPGALQQRPGGRGRRHHRWCSVAHPTAFPVLCPLRTQSAGRKSLRGEEQWVTPRSIRFCY